MFTLIKTTQCVNISMYVFQQKPHFILNIIDINDELISVLSPLWKVDLVFSIFPRQLAVYTTGHYQSIN